MKWCYARCSRAANSGHGDPEIVSGKDSGVHLFFKTAKLRGHLWKMLSGVVVVPKKVIWTLKRDIATLARAN